MKKLICMTLTLVLVLSMAACGASNTKEPSANSTPNSQASVQEDPAVIFQYKGTDITMNVPAEPIVSALGAPKSYTEEASCAFDGTDKTYYYGSFYLSTYPENGKDLVYCVWFADDGAATQAGIRIGSTKDEVIAAYPDASLCDDILYVTGNASTLTIVLEKDVVTSIRYDASIYSGCQ